MKLRIPPRIQQILSLAGCAILLGSQAMAQTDAILVLRDGSQRPAKVIGMLPGYTSMEITTPDGAGKLGMSVAQVKEVRMAAPPEMNTALLAFQNKNYDAAIAGLSAVNAKWKGLPASWASQASSMLGLAYLAKGNIAQADQAFREFRKLYPDQTSLADVGDGLVSIAKKDYDSAKQKLLPIAEDALKTKNVTAENALAISQTFLGLGQIAEAEGNYSEALQEYLRTVTLFYHDRAAAAVAQEKADALRKAHEGVTVP
jgi:tetratricopeptide (TPR) repeat protein